MPTFAGQLTLTWNDNSDNEDGFKIERASGGSSFVEIAAVGANVATYTDTTVVENQSYTYRVKAYNQFGDSGYSNSATGLVEIVGAPTISSLDDISILEGGESGVIPFTIDDSDTNVASLVVSIESSNPSLISNDGMILGGSGANRTFNLVPVGGASGTSQITVSVFDGINTSSTSFELEVLAVTAPTISPLSDIRLSSGQAVSPIVFSIGDDDTPVENLTVSVTSSNSSLIPIGNISVTGNGNDRNLNVDLVEGELGSSTITITVGDGTSEAIETVNIVVESIPSILSQPVNTEAIVGDITALNIEVTGYPEPSIQWYFEGEAIAGANESELLIVQLEKSDEGRYSVVVENELGRVVSNTVQLSVESLITVVQAPVDVTVLGEGTAILSVEAQGPGLTYQWYRGSSGDKSNPIQGATSSTYETDTITADANFWVEISTGGIAQGLETFNSSTIEVNFRLPSRYYFGSVGPGDEGAFGLMVRGDNTAVFLANLEFLSTPLEVMDLVVDEQGFFEYSIDGLTIISGIVTDGSVSGVFTGTNYSFSGLRSVNDGMTSELAGLYSAVMPNTSDGQILVIAGPNGESFVSIALSGSGDSGQAAINSTGVLMADLSAEYTMALALDESYASLSGIVLIGEKGYSVDGQREDLEPKTQLFNTSIRGQAKGGDSTMIAGFVVGGSGTKKVLIRGLGPSLADRGVSDAIVDPVISLYKMGDSSAVAVNDNWGSAVNASDVAISAQIVGATPLASNSSDAALLVELTEGVYTAIIQNLAGDDGTALVEVFDVSEAEGIESNATLANISMRGEIGRGDDVTIAGFVVTGDSPKRLFIRAMGTELEASGVIGALEDPRLKIYQATAEGSELISENDDWQEEASLNAEIASRSGAFPFDANSKSAAKVIWLDPGVYTAVAESSDTSTGVVLVEVYEAR